MTFHFHNAAQRAFLGINGGLPHVWLFMMHVTARLLNTWPFEHAGHSCNYISIQLSTL